MGAFTFKSRGSLPAGWNFMFAANPIGGGLLQGGDRSWRGGSIMELENIQVFKATVI